MCGCRAAVDLDGHGLGNHGNHGACYAPRRKDCSTRGKDANEHECKGAGWYRGIVSAMVLEPGKLPEDEEKRGEFYKEKERGKHLGFLRNKPWIKVQRP